MEHGLHSQYGMVAVHALEVNHLMLSPSTLPSMYPRTETSFERNSHFDGFLSFYLERQELEIGDLRRLR